MLKKVLSSLLVTGVFAATLVAPVLAAPAAVPDVPVPSHTDRHLFVDAENSWDPLYCEINLDSKTGLGYIIYDANQCGGELRVGRGLAVEPVVVSLETPPSIPTGPQGPECPFD